MKSIYRISSRLLWRQLAVILLLFTTLFAQGQIVLLNDPGTTHNDTDGPTLDTYGPVNISNCSSVRFELNYSFSLPWEGSGNMESSDECAFVVPPCPGNPQTPLAPGCGNCWDFLWAQFIVDGVEVGGDLIGEAGTDNSEQSGSITLDYCTMGMGNSASISVSTQTWAADEAVTFSSIMIICYQGVPMANANPNPICEDEILNLNANVIDNGVVDNSNWTGPGTIDDPTSLNTTVTDIPPGPANYTITVTDINGCMVTDNVLITVHPTPDAFPAGPLEECDDGTGRATFDLTSLNPTITGGMAGNVFWFRDAGLTSAINPPNAFYTNSTTVYAIIDNGFCESEVIEVELVVLPQPNAFPTQMELCEDVAGSGLASFDLTQIWDDINGGTGDMVLFFQDAGGLIPINSPYISGSGVIYSRVSNGVCESELVRIQLFVYPAPMGNDIEIRVCEDLAGLGFSEIDLTQYEDQIAMGVGLTITYYEDNQFLNEVNNPYRASVGTTILYAKVSNDDCDSRPIEIRITVLPTPGALEAVIDVCENPPGSGLGTFELDSLTIFVIGNQQNVDVLWYADSLKTIPFDHPYYGGDTTIFAQVSNGICSSGVVRVELITIEKPAAMGVTDTLCSDQSGTALFDLEKYAFDIASDTTREEVIFAADSQFTMPVKTNFRTDDTVIYARVTRGDCESDVVKIVLVTTPGPILSGLNDVVACDSFVLPIIPGINLSGNEAFYDQRNGGGIRYQSGDVIRRTQRLYYFDQLKECIDQDSFEIEIVPMPEAGDSQSVTICEGAMVDLLQYISGDVNGTFVDLNMSGGLNGTNFDATGLSGNTYDFKYIVPGEGPCGPDSTVLTVEVQDMVEAGLDSVITLCLGDSVNLLDFLTGDLGGRLEDVTSSGGLIGNEWHSLQSGVGQFQVIYTIGDGVVCPEDMANLTIEVNPAIILDEVQDVEVCDYYVLPEIQGTNAHLAIYNTPGGGGSTYLAGDTIKSSTTIFITGEVMGYCDDEISFEVTILETKLVEYTDQLCFDENVAIGSEVFDRNRTTGTVVLAGAADNGCDSIVNVDLTFFPEAIENITRTLCRGQSLIINGTTYDQNNATGQEILIQGSFRGCDSTININLSFDDFAMGSFNPTLCAGDTIQINGKNYHENQTTGSDTLFGQGAGGCDSIVSITVDIYRASSRIDSTLCTGEFLMVNGTLYDEDNPSGVEILESEGRFGCDSIVNIQLTFNAPSYQQIERTLCFGDSIIVNGVAYNENNPSGTEVIVNGAINGCDSIVEINLDFQATANGFVNGEICASDTVVINGNNYYAGKNQGMDTIPGGSRLGCDSVVIINLEVLDNVESTYREMFCPDDEIIINGTKYNQNNPFGIETYPGMAANGCDSVVYIDLSFEALEVTPSQQEIELELGDSTNVVLSTNFSYDSVYWSPTLGLSCTDCPNPIITGIQSTVYTVTFVTANGCTVSATIQVRVSLDTDIFLPNSFSPNGDNINDRLTLFVKQGKVERINMFNIYSRWGELVYSEQGTNPDDGTHVGWDGWFNGQRMNPGVYVVQVDVDLLGGRTMTLSGTVTLIE